MPIYRLTPPGDVIQADSARIEGAHTVLRGTVTVMGQPREIVVLRVPSTVRVEVVENSLDVESPPAATPDQPLWGPGRLGHPR